MDDRLRHLERAAQQGDPGAALRLLRERMRGASDLTFCSGRTLDWGLTAVLADRASGLEVRLCVLHRAIDGADRTMRRLLEGPPPRVVVDLGQAARLGTDGFAALLRASDALEGAGGGLVLIRASRRIQLFIEMLGLKGYFRQRDDLREAVRALTRPRPVQRRALPERPLAGIPAPPRHRR